MSHKLALRQQRLIPFKRHILGARFEHEVSPRWPWYKLQKGGRIHNYPQGFTRKLFRKGGYFPHLPSKNRRINISNLLTSENPCAANSQKKIEVRRRRRASPLPSFWYPWEDDSSWSSWFVRVDLRDNHWGIWFSHGIRQCGSIVPHWYSNI